MIGEQDINKFAWKQRTHMEHNDVTIRNHWRRFLLLKRREGWYSRFERSGVAGSRITSHARMPWSRGPYVQHPGPTALFGLVFLLGLTDGPIYHSQSKNCFPPSPNYHPLSTLTTPTPSAHRNLFISESSTDLRWLMILDSTSFHHPHPC